MKFNDLKEKIMDYKIGGTKQSWRKDSDFFYDNEYIRVLRIDSSNVSGGNAVKKGKQWSIIIEIKKDFQNLSNWKIVKTFFGDEIRITKVNRGECRGNFGIRFYKMSIDPTNEIIKEILDFIFED